MNKLCDLSKLELLDIYNFFEETLKGYEKVTKENVKQVERYINTIPKIKVLLEEYYDITIN